MFGVGDSGSQGLRVEFKMKWSMPHSMLQVIPKKNTFWQAARGSVSVPTGGVVFTSPVRQFADPVGIMNRNVEWDHDFCECCCNPSTHMTRRQRQRK